MQAQLSAVEDRELLLQAELQEPEGNVRVVVPVGEWEVLVRAQSEGSC